MTIAHLIFVTTATTGGGVLFSSRCTFSQKERRRDCFSKVYSYTIPDKKCNKYSIPMSKTSITPTKIPSTPTKIPSTPTKIPSTPTENLRCFVARKFLSQIYALFWCTFYAPKKYGGVPKMTNIRYEYFLVNIRNG